MRAVPVFLALIAVTVVALVPSTPASADELWPPTSSSDPEAPTNALSLLTVPDVRDLTMADAFRVIRDAGLQVGRVERTCTSVLEHVLGRRYAVGVVAEQMPGPSIANARSRVPRGARVHLRVSSLADGIEFRSLETTPYGMPAETVPPPPEPTTPYTPQITPHPTPPPATPSPYRPYAAPVDPTPPPTTYHTPGWTGPGAPPRPPPPYPLPGTKPTRPVTERTSPSWPPPIAPGPTDRWSPPQHVLPPRPQPEPQVYERGSVAPTTAPTARSMWTVRAIGGAAFHFGTDSGDVGLYAGADLGYRFASGWGVAAFYRYELCRFDRTVPMGLLEDEGNWHHIGLKGTYETPLGCGGRLYTWAGLGAAYSLIENYQADGDGFGGFAELGIGYKFAPNMRAVFGVNVHGIYTSAVRLDAANDEDERLLWTLAPVLGLEFGF